MPQSPGSACYYHPALAEGATPTPTPPPHSSSVVQGIAHKFLLHLIVPQASSICLCCSLYLESPSSTCLALLPPLYAEVLILRDFIWK